MLTADRNDQRLHNADSVCSAVRCLQALLARLEVKLRLQQQNVANIALLLQRLFPKTARSGDAGRQRDGRDACIACWQRGAAVGCCSARSHIMPAQTEQFPV